MNIIYGQSGKPVATIVDDALFWGDGSQIGFLDEDYIFSIEDGAHFGCVVSGVVFNSAGKPEGFTSDCSPAIPLGSPKLGRLPPKVRTVGENIRHLEPRVPPEFLRAALANTKTELFK